MKSINVDYKKHILVCVNERDEGDCCSDVFGKEIHRKIKDFVMKNDLVNEIWVTRSRCLGFCNKTGATIVIYPDKLWLTEFKEEDLDKIFRLIKE